MEDGGDRLAPVALTTLGRLSGARRGEPELGVELLLKITRRAACAAEADSCWSKSYRMRTEQGRRNIESSSAQILQSER